MDIGMVALACRQEQCVSTANGLLIFRFLSAGVGTSHS